MTLPKCLLFDLDGTIFDSLSGIEYSVKAAFGACGLALRKEGLRELIGPPIRVILSKAGEVEDGDALDRLEGAFRHSYDTEGWRRTVCFPDAQMVLRTMRESGHRLFVVSNKPRHISVRILEAEGILGLFEEVLTADSRVPAFRGKAEMIAQVMTKFGMVQDSCLFVGDTMEDAQAAASAGIGFVRVTNGYGEIAEMPVLPNVWKVDSFRQFLPLVTKEPVCDR